MNFVEVASVATILGVFLTLYALINNRALKREARRISDLLVEESRNTREILKSQQEILARIERGQQEARKEMAEAIRYLGDLIRAEGVRTREAIKGISG